MAAVTHTATYRVTSINESGTNRVSINFVQEFDDGSGNVQIFGGNPISLNLSLDEAAGYFPGQTYTVTFAPSA